MSIVIISASIREGRKSHRVALYLQESLTGSGHETHILDLKTYAFPLFDERLKFQKNPTPETLDFAEHVRKAEGVVLVTPEYNGGYPAGLKNVIDLLNDEWRRKPVAVCTVSDGAFGGAQVITSLLFSLWKVKAWVVAHMPVPKVSEAFGESGVPADAEMWAKRSSALFAELGWAMEARRRMEG